MASEDYTSTPSTGKLKLKGVKESKITKKKKKNKSSVKGDDKPAVGGDVGDNLVVLRKLEDEDEGMEVETKGEGRRKSQEAVDAVEGEGDGDGAGDVGMRVKTDAERRYDEQRRRRVRPPHLTTFQSLSH